MANKGESNLKPWCPFCGMDIGRPTDAVQRKLNEFPMGRCECGAVYVCDATGHNVGAAMVECLVNACNDEWDLAWELVAEEDYLTGRIEDYDDISHQVCPKRNIDGRAARGVLFFIRLHKGLAEIVERYDQNQQKLAKAPRGEGAAGSTIRELEPERDPKRTRKRASKKQVKELAEKGDLDGLVDLCFDDKRTLRFLQRLLYEPVAKDRYNIAWTMGEVCARISTREPAPVADQLHRLFQSCSDSASTSWGMVEAIGAIVACRPDIYGAFTRHLYNFLNDSATQEAVLWGLGEIATTRPDLIRKTPFYSLFGLLGHEKPEIRALVARMLGRISAKEAGLQLLPLQQDQTPILIFEQGQPLETSVAEVAATAIENIHKGEKNGE
ncbi:DVU0298 family protein [Desulfogranum marinum]|uniref:DVU0298 family protein n=1 Tax=Desulfogranum marinum TaxID=453220 RepID=UPI001964BEF3|nr:DVU0298 family protein [Desulfogranum marinum]MBM9511147.1 HEAT repeat domain-containing protein [Desulfogranum marinum]